MKYLNPAVCQQFYLALTHPSASLACLAGCQVFDELIALLG
jgi:hypothetical protein